MNGAEIAYRHVLDLTGATETQFKAHHITTLYNLALLYEAQHHYDKASSLYKAILKEHPNYIDCMRLFTLPLPNIDSFKKNKFQVTYGWAAWRVIEGTSMKPLNGMRTDSNYLHVYANGLIFRFKETFMIQPNDVSAWSLLGNLHLTKDEWLPAQKKFEYILAQQENRNDPYALLSLANIYYSAKFDKKEKVRFYYQQDWGWVGVGRRDLQNLVHI